MKSDTTQDPEKNASAQDSGDPINPIKEGQHELDEFVAKFPLEAMEYLKMLREEITKSDSSRTRYTFLTWILVAIFALMDLGAISVKIEFAERIDQILVFKLLPAAILSCFYLMAARMFVQRERLVIFYEISCRLFSCKSFPLNYYIKPTHFMLAERLLNLGRPSDEMLGNVLMLSLIVTITVYGPIAFAIYGYYSIIAKFGLADVYVFISIAVGTVALIQGMVSLRGCHVMNKQDAAKETAPRVHKFND